MRTKFLTKFHYMLEINKILSILNYHYLSATPFPFSLIFALFPYNARDMQEDGAGPAGIFIFLS